MSTPTTFQRPAHWPRGFLIDAAIRCPSCRSHQSVMVRTDSWARFTAAGTDVCDGPDYTPESAAVCGNCHHTGQLTHFTDFPLHDRLPETAQFRVTWAADGHAPTSVWPDVAAADLDDAREIARSYWPGISAALTDDALTVTVEEPDVPGLIDAVRDELLWTLGPPTFTC
ncbi:hypothetical protein ACFQNE_14200 [Gordonia phosphorivorans]|uniref:Cytochrome c domain-containing protein n=1 Tax=Gordonia phosphorivorans TaxID=1056982 RepID=A0ABV6H7L9_9ACTN